MKKMRRNKRFCRNVGHSRGILLMEKWQLNSSSLTVAFVHPCTTQQHFLSAFRVCGTQTPPPRTSSADFDAMAVHPDTTSRAGNSTLRAPQPEPLYGASETAKNETKRDKSETNCETGGARGRVYIAITLFSFPFSFPFFFFPSSASASASDLS